MFSAAVSPSDELQRAAGAALLSVKNILGQSRIDRLFQEGSAKIRLPRRADGGFEAILINTAGGLTGGDTMAWRFDLASGANAVLTSQACEKIYAANSGTANVAVQIHAAAQSRVAWLPQETILFDKARLSRTLEVRLEADAEALIAEPVAFGRLAMGERVICGMFHDRWRVWQDGRLIHADELRIGPEISKMAGTRAVLGGASCFATLLLVSKHVAELLDPARGIIGADGGASSWNGKLLARLFAEDAYSLRKRLIPLVNLLNREAALPKCWSL